MKGLIITFAISLAFFTSYAQLRDGALVLGGSVGLNSDQVTGDTKYTNIAVSPSFGYALAEDKAVGLAFNWGSSRFDIDGGTGSTNSSFETGIFYRKYNNIVEKLYFNWQVSAGVNFIKNDNGATETTATAVGARFNPGLTWVATDKLLVVSRVGNLSYFQRTGDLEGGSFNLSFNSLSLGLEIVL